MILIHSVLRIKKKLKKFLLIGIGIIQHTFIVIEIGSLAFGGA